MSRSLSWLVALRRSGALVERQSQKSSVRSTGFPPLHLSATLFLPLAALLFSGCAGATITSVEVPDPEQPRMIVRGQVEGLAHRAQECSVVAEWNGWLAAATVPMSKGGAPEAFEVELTNWLPKPGRSRWVSQMEVRFTFPRPKRAIARKRLPPAWSSTAVFRKKVRPRRPVDPRPKPGPKPTDDRRTPPPGWGKLLDPSRTLDKPTRHDLSKPIVCEISSGAGPRYLKVDSTPNKLIKLVVDVRSQGSPAHVGESTWWRVELLDQDGLAMPHEMQEFVGLGQDMRHIAKWRFDGSPVIFKLSSGSKSGDWIRVRFE